MPDQLQHMLRFSNGGLSQKLLCQKNSRTAELCLACGKKMMLFLSEVLSAHQGSCFQMHFYCKKHTKENPCTKHLTSALIPLCWSQTIYLGHKVISTVNFSLRLVKNYFYSSFLKYIGFPSHQKILQSYCFRMLYKIDLVQILTVS